MYTMKHQHFKSVRTKVPVLIAVIATLLAAMLITVLSGKIGHATKSALAHAGSLGPNSGLLPRDKLIEESAIQVNLSKETVRLLLYKGEAYSKTVWYVLLDSSDSGLAHDLGVNYRRFSRSQISVP